MSRPDRAHPDQTERTAQTDPSATSTPHSAPAGGGPARLCTRRGLLVGGGAGAAGMALASCGGGGGSGTGSSATTGSDGSLRVPAADTKVGGMTFYAGSGAVAGLVVTQPAQGEFKAFDATCPHQGCAANQWQDARIVCPCHGSAFDPASGAAVQGPATSGLRALTVQTDGTDLVIRG